MMDKTLLIVIPDRLSDLIKKGEVTARYYNPDDLFDEVHILLTNDDRPDLSILQRTVGRAKLYVHNLPLPSFTLTLGRQPFLIKRWVKAGLILAEQIQPDLIRTHGNYYNGYLAAQIKKQLAIPLVVSLHTNPDEEQRGRNPWWPKWKMRLYYELRLRYECETLRAADWVLPVYEPIREYAERRGARRIQISYNALNPDHLRKKESYELHSPPRIISVGRQFKEKNPDNLIRAAARFETELTMVGDGPYHDYLRQVAQSCGVADRVIFRPGIPNDKLCRMLPDFDIFATHTEYWEISKSVLEPLLTGLPIVLNRRIGKPVPELQGDWVMLVENSCDGYYTALQHLLTDHAAREALGRRAYTHAQQRYAPHKTEQVFVDIYKSLVN